MTKLKHHSEKSLISVEQTLSHKKFEIFFEFL